MKSTDHHFQRPKHRHRHFHSHHCWKKNPPVWSFHAKGRVGLPGKNGRRMSRRIQPTSSNLDLISSGKKERERGPCSCSRLGKWNDELLDCCKKEKNKMASKAVKESKEGRPLHGGKLGGVGSPKLWRRWGCTDGVAADEGFRPSISCEAWGETSSVTGPPHFHQMALLICHESRET